MEPSDIKSVESEAGIIASIIFHPEYTYYSELLSPNHFTDPANAYMYYAVCELAKLGVVKADAYNITNILNARHATREKKITEDLLSLPKLIEWVDTAGIIARNSVEEYQLLVKNVMDAAFKRETLGKLKECEKLCFTKNTDDIEQEIYKTLDDVMCKFSTNNEIPQYKDVVDQMWKEILERQSGEVSGIKFRFPTLNDFATIEPGELFIFIAEAKQGKSIMLLNCAADILKQGKRVMYIDSELNTRLFTCRMISHLTGIEFSRVKNGPLERMEEEKIANALSWLKEQSFTHLYMPLFDSQSIYTAVKKVQHTQGIDVLIIDYFKDGGDEDAFATSQELGRIVDLVKNRIAGDMGIAALGAAQATRDGRTAGSVKIGRNASTIAYLYDKTKEEIEEDGKECGNKKLRVILNRNGAQMGPDEFIDLNFDGNHILYAEARQHSPRSDSPY